MRLNINKKCGTLTVLTLSLACVSAYPPAYGDRVSLAGGGSPGATLYFIPPGGTQNYSNQSFGNYGQSSLTTTPCCGPVQNTNASHESLKPSDNAKHPTNKPAITCPGTGLQKPCLPKDSSRPVGNASFPGAGVTKPLGPANRLPVYSDASSGIGTMPQVQPGSMYPYAPSTKIMNTRPCYGTGVGGHHCCTPDMCNKLLNRKTPRNRRNKCDPLACVENYKVDYPAVIKVHGKIVSIGSPPKKPQPTSPGRIIIECPTSD